MADEQNDVEAIDSTHEERFVEAHGTKEDTQFVEKPTDAEHAEFAEAPKLTEAPNPAYEAMNEKALVVDEGGTTVHKVDESLESMSLVEKTAVEENTSADQAYVLGAKMGETSHD